MPTQIPSPTRIATPVPQYEPLRSPEICPQQKREFASPDVSP